MQIYCLHTNRQNCWRSKKVMKAEDNQRTGSLCWDNQNNIFIFNFPTYKPCPNIVGRIYSRSIRCRIRIRLIVKHEGYFGSGSNSRSIGKCKYSRFLLFIYCPNYVPIFDFILLEPATNDPPTPTKTPSMDPSTCTCWIYNDVLMIKDWTSRKCVLCVIFLMTKQNSLWICRAESVNGCNLRIQMWKHLIKVLIFSFFPRLSHSYTEHYGNNGKYCIILFMSHSLLTCVKPKHRKTPL